MKKVLPLIMLLCVALVGSSCSQKEAAPPASTPTPHEAPRPKSGKKTPRKKGARSEQESSVAKPYSYTGPRMPGLKVSHVSVPGNFVALTFDDGPSSAYTPRILDILNKYGAKATFFVVGRSVAKNSNILARAVAEGHEIGSHTWSHIKMPSAGVTRVMSEMDRTNAAVSAATGITPKVMRPPYGAVNANLVSLMKSRYGMSTIMWDVDTRDWQHPGVSVVTNRAVGRATPGSIILLHDIHESTLHAVEGIVSGLQARGFRLVTVSQLLALGRHAAQQAATPPAADTPAAASTDAPQTATDVVPQQTVQPEPAAAAVSSPPTPVAPSATTSAEHAGAASISGGNTPAL